MRLSVVTTADPLLPVIEALAARLASGVDATALPVELPVELLVMNDLGVPGLDAALAAHAGPQLAVRCMDTGGRGQLAAMLHGITLARGDAVLAIDADMAANVDDLPRLLAAHRAGADLVYGRRVRRTGTPFWRRFASTLCNALLRLVAGVPLHDANTPLVLLGPRARVLLASLPPGLPPKLGLPWLLGDAFREVPIETVSVAGKQSTYDTRRLWQLFRQQLAGAYRLRCYRRAQRVAA